MPDQTNQAQAVSLSTDRLNLLESQSLVYDAVIPTDVHPLHLLEPAFWAHSAVKLQPWHEIRARAEDGSWMGRYVVLSSDRTWAKVKCIAFHEFAPIVAKEPEQPKGAEEPAAATSDEASVIDAHKVVHRGPKGHSVVRIADKAVLVEGLATRAEAENWLKAHAFEVSGVKKAA